MKTVKVPGERELSSGRWIAQPRIKGERITSPTVDTHDQLVEWHKEILRQIDNHQYVAPKKILIFRQLSIRWIQEQYDEAVNRPAESHEPATIANMQRHVEILNSVIGDLRCDDVEYSTADPRKRIAAPKSEGGFGIDPKPVMKTLSIILRFGVIIKCGIRHDFTQDFQRTRKKGANKTRKIHAVGLDGVLNAKQIRSLIDATILKFKLLVMVLAYTGVRISEALALQWKHINYPYPGFITVEQKVSTSRMRGQDESIKYRFYPPKNGESREIKILSGSLIKLLTTMKVKASSDELLFHGDAPVVRHEVVGKGGQTIVLEGEPILNRKGTINDVLINAYKQAGISLHITPHVLRHSFASILFDMGKPATYVQKQLGHKTLSVTLDTYTHIINKHEKKENELADEFDRYENSESP